MVEALTSDGAYKYVAKMALAGYIKAGYVIGVKLDNSFTINDLRRIAHQEGGIVIVEYEKGAKHIKVRPSKRRDHEEGKGSIGRRPEGSSFGDH